ncbi:MAG TPA: YraN family protein [Rhodanobacteraceae bacterium]
MRKVGDAFEDRALAHLERAGLKLIARNYHTRFGEIDLIMRDGEALVFVEVRYRHDARFGGASASVTPRKREKLILAAEGFLGEHTRYANLTCRFDVVAFDGAADAPQGRWQRAAFDAF